MYLFEMVVVEDADGQLEGEDLTAVIVKTSHDVVEALQVTC